MFPVSRARRRMSARMVQWCALLCALGVSLVGARADAVPASELVQRSRDALLWGERFNKPVFVGIKAGPVPDEGHVILKRNGKKNGNIRSNALLTLAGIQWKQETAYAITANTISFNGNLTGLNDLLTKTPPSPAFAGWVVNSYDNLK